MSYWEHSCFITLTYDPEHYPVNGSLSKRELQLFFKRLRKQIGGFKYYACGEYGDLTIRPHYHAILFGVGSSNVRKIKESWPFGFVRVGTCTKDSIQYVCGYVQKKLTGKRAEEKYGSILKAPFQLQSQAIGLRYALENSSLIKTNLGCTINGVKVGLPRYYRKKLDIDSSLLAEKAMQVENEMIDKLSEKGIVTEFGQVEAQRRSREQSDKNINARLSLRNKYL